MSIMITELTDVTLVEDFSLLTYANWIVKKLI